MTATKGLIEREAEEWARGAKVSLEIEGFDGPITSYNRGRAEGLLSALRLIAGGSP